MNYEIKNRWTGDVIASKEAGNIRDAIVRMVSDGISLRGADLSGADLSDADLSDADLRGAVLSGAVLRGADLSDADLSDADLRGADLSGAVLSDADLRGAVLSDADLRGAVLSDADLRGAVLSGADLSDAVLRGADLSGADIMRYIKVPHLHAAILTAIDAGGELDMSAWHTCETTHCRAGWAITLAGAAGKVLEAFVGSNVAGAMITLVSCPWMEKVPNFYASDEAALADIKACAEREALEELK